MLSVKTLVAASLAVSYVAALPVWPVRGPEDPGTYRAIEEPIDEATERIARGWSNWLFHGHPLNHENPFFGDYPAQLDSRPVHFVPQRAPPAAIERTNSVAEDLVNFFFPPHDYLGPVKDSPSLFVVGGERVALGQIDHGAAQDFRGPGKGRGSPTSVIGEIGNDDLRDMPALEEVEHDDWRKPSSSGWHF